MPYTKNNAPLRDMRYTPVFQVPSYSQADPIDGLSLRPKTFHTAEAFGNTRALEAEIGCGSGHFLTGLAGAYPDRNFLGLEQREKWLSKADEIGKRSALPNLKFLRTNAVMFISQCLREESIDAFHMYFPDPWPKRKHRHRRLWTPGFFRLLHTRLLKGGFTYLATDVESYFRTAKSAVAACGAPWNIIEECENKRPFFDHLKTKYEMKFEKEGRKLYYLWLEKSRTV